MKIGVIKTSYKENEKRVPVYPEHLSWINSEIRKQLVFENNYGQNFGFSNEYFTRFNIKMASREELIKNSDILILPKQVSRDLEETREHQVIWGWSHCVQQKNITQLAIDKKLTLVAWEAMYYWGPLGEKIMHIFYKNNEIAGYAAVLHLLEILGIDGLYGPRRKAIVIGYGSVSRGAIYALQGRGFNNIHVFSKRPVHLIADRNPDVYYKNIFVGKNEQIMVRNFDGTTYPFIEELAEAEIICNGVLQDTDRPIVFVNDSQLSKLKSGTAIIDISCDEGMGFSFAKPTTFENPIFMVGDNIIYYSVDHTPAYLWNAASREISYALIPFLSDIAKGPEDWEKNETIKKSVEIRDGVILNKKILSFQNRDLKYPYNIK